MRIIPIASSALAALLVLVGGTTYGADHECTDRVAEELAKASIIDSDVEKIIYSQNIQGSNSLVGYHAWVYLKNQPGKLVIDLRPNCQCMQVYTQGGCRVPGVKSF